jgi:hypothetical protein
MARREDLESWAAKLEVVNPAMAVKVRELLSEIGATETTFEEKADIFVAGLNAGFTLQSALDRDVVADRIQAGMRAAVELLDKRAERDRIAALEALAVLLDELELAEMAEKMRAAARAFAARTRSSGPTS